MILDTYGMLTIVGEAEKKTYGKRNIRIMKVRCECGQEKEVAYQALRCGDTTSCGCKKKKGTRKGTGKSYNGIKFGSLTVLRDGENKKRGSRGVRTVDVQCECGETKNVVLSNLKNGSHTSCGCLRGKHGNQEPPVQRKHGMHGRRPYNIWMNMKQSCDKPSHQSYHRRGMQGISYQATWSDFEIRWEDVQDGYSPAKYFIRKDLKKDFDTDNCCRSEHYNVSQFDLRSMQTNQGCE